MGRGIYEGSPRTERVQLETRSSDPSNPSNGEAWLRTDLTGTDKVGEYRWYDGASVNAVDVVTPGTTSSPVEEVLRVQTPTGKGVIKTAPRADATYPEQSLQHAGSPLGLGYSAIPDSVVYQYLAENFASSVWTDSVGSSDMTVNGLTASTFSTGESSVFGDGVDEDGLADGPESLPTNATWGVAMTVQFSNQTETEFFFGVEGANNTNRFQLRSASGGFQFILDDENSNTLFVETDNEYDDGTPKALIINKTGPSAADIDFYVDDMSTPAAKTVNSDQSFDPNDYTQTFDLAFCARNVEGSTDLPIEAHCGAFEFNTAPYSQSDRDAFVDRRPEV